VHQFTGNGEELTARYLRIEPRRPEIIGRDRKRESAVLKEYGGFSAVRG